MLSNKKLKVGSVIDNRNLTEPIKVVCVKKEWNYITILGSGKNSNKCHLIKILIDDVNNYNIIQPIVGAIYRANKCRKLLVSEINNFKLILEIGSGLGMDACWFSHLSKSFIAIEIDSEYCKIIKNKFKLEQISNAIIINGDGQFLPFRNDIFDTVFCRAVLHHVIDPYKMVSEMFRVNNKNGISLAIDEPNKLNPFWHIAKFLVKFLYLRIYFLKPKEFLEDRNILTNFYSWELANLFKKAKYKYIKIIDLWLPYVTYNKYYFKIWLLLEKLLEKSLISKIFGQLYIIGIK